MGYFVRSFRQDGEWSVLHMDKSNTQFSGLFYWKIVAEVWKTSGFLASRGEEFNTGPEMRLDCSELLCKKVLLKYKRERESFWYRHQKGVQKEGPLTSDSTGVVYFLISYYSESKECLEVVKTSLDPLP